MKKIDVMIVDDDRLAIDYLQSIHDWDSNGFKIVATACTGKQAYQKYLEFLPDLVITDMRMPHGNGIDLAIRIREHGDHTKILLLTAYSDFDVAKKAIELGINEYIIKDEINAISIQEKLVKIKETIYKDRKVSNVLNSKVLLDVFSTEMISDDKYLSNSHSLIEMRQYSIMLERDNPFLPTSKIEEKESVEMGEYKLNKMLDGLNLGVQLQALMINKNQMILLVKGDFGFSQQRIKSELIGLSQIMQEELKKRFGYACTFFIVPTLKNILEIKELYRKKRNSMKMKHIYGCGAIYDIYDMSMDEQEKEIAFDDRYIETSLTEGNHKDLEEYLKKSYQEIQDTRNYKGLVFFATRYLDLLEKWTENILDALRLRDFRGCIEKGRASCDLEGIKCWCSDTALFFCKEIHNVNDMNYSSAINKAIKHINHNYQLKTLSIKEISQVVGLSTSRLSVLFKKETGQTINKYITSIRIENAKSLLLEGNLKINEIAECVGYGSSQYFSQVFLELTGITPRAYRKRAKK